ncbi:MAG: right-handed parallel beta-helix repeat-containing protein [candidate division Zixibacteria bacterium]|nr:right-handed parallel beta-helix repeat-containing protein [candidate division Zixibacteria bacterium]
MRKLVCLLLVVVAAQISFATVIHVPSEQPTIQAGINGAEGSAAVSTIGSNCTGDLRKSRHVWHVYPDGSGDAPTIQAAYDSCSPGDTILLAEGVYTGEGNRIVQIVYTPVVIRSVQGPEVTIVDAEYLSAGMHFGYVDSTTRLEGLTIQHGRGFGIFVFAASPIITDCIITDNYSFEDGGGIYCNHSSPTFIDCSFIGNYAPQNGGAFYCGPYGTLTLINCLFVDNVADQSGAAIYSDLTWWPTIIRNCLFASNHCEQGGVVTFTANSPQFTSCTFANNSRGIYALEHPYASFDSCLIAFNHDVSVFCDSEMIEGSVFACCDIYGNLLGDWVSSFADQLGTNGNFSLDPQFCDTTSANWFIRETSPCAPANNDCASLIGALGIGCIFICGDADGDGMVNIADVVYLINYIFSGGPPPDPLLAGDVDCNSMVNIADVVYLIDYIFAGGPEPCAGCP